MATDVNTQVWGGPGAELYHGEDLDLSLTGDAGVDPSPWTLLTTITDPADDSVVLTVVPTTSGPNSANKYTITSSFTRAQTGTTLTLDEYNVDVWRTNSGSNKRLAGGVLRLSTPDRPQS